MRKKNFIQYCIMVITESIELALHDMIIELQSPHIRLTEKQEDQILIALEKIEKIIPRAESVQLIFKEIHLENKNLIQVEMNLLLPGGKIFASERNESMETAVKELTKKMKRRIIRFRENQRKKRENLSKINRRMSWELKDLL